MVRVSQSKKLSPNSNSRLQTHAELNSITSEKHIAQAPANHSQSLTVHSNYRQSHKIASQIISRLQSHLRSQTRLTPNRKRGTCRGIHTQQRDSFSFTHSRNTAQSTSTHPKRCRLGTGGRLHLLHTRPLCEALLLATNSLGVKTDKNLPSQNSLQVTQDCHLQGHAHKPRPRPRSHRFECLVYQGPGSGSVLIITGPVWTPGFPPRLPIRYRFSSRSPGPELPIRAPSSGPLGPTNLTPAKAQSSAPAHS